MRLHGSSVVVTGASSGIGAAIAREMASRGARVTLVARRREALEKLAGEIGSGAVVEPADLSDRESIEDLGRRLLAAGTPDVLVNNAGAGRWLAIDETDPGEVEQMTWLPYLGAFELTRILVPSMIARGSGRIVSMTSLSGYTYVPGATGYVVARWAMRAFASQLRLDLRGTGVGSTLIAPSEVDSPYFDNNPGSKERIPRAALLLGGAVTPEVVAKATADSVEHDRNEVIVPKRAAIIIKMTPRPVFDFLVRSSGWKRSRR
jgi:uncharacterized protein